MPSTSRSLAILCNGHHGLNHDVRIDTAFRQSQLPAAKFLEIKLSQAFRTAEIALGIMRDAVRAEEIAEVEPKAGFRVVRVTILKAFDVAKRLCFVKAVFKLHQSNSERSKIVAGRYLCRRRASHKHEKREQLS